jgi:hypothetical protein
MSQRIVVNGVEYDSPESMPHDVRQQYERAMAALNQVNDKREKIVQSVPGGMKVSVTTRRAQYNIDGKTYDDLAQMPPDIRARVEQALAEAPKLSSRDQGRTEVRVINVEVERPKQRGGTVLRWLVIAAIIAAAIALLR